MGYFLLGILVLGGLLLLARWYSRASSHDLAQGARTFIAVFSALASTGLLLAGRFGLALVTLAAMVMAIRAIRRGRRGADPLDGPASDPVEIETGLLRMRLDRATGEVEGEVTDGRFAGSTLGGLGQDDLLELLDEARTRDPRSASLIEAYLDRRFSGWREAGRDAAGDMDEDEALRILGLEPGAAPEAIRQAHRRLMARLHPDHGGSTFLAMQINRAKDILLAKVGAARR